MTTDVIVIGAGPTGLTLACSLRGFDVRVRVIDKAAGPAVTSRANFVHARGSEVLDRLGALGDLPERSKRSMQITSYLGDRPVMKLRFGDPGQRTAAPPMVISQAAVEANLRERFAALGGRIEWGTELTGLSQDADAVVAELSTGETIRSSWLVGADGTSSSTRKLTGITAPGVTLSERFLLADLRLDWDLDRSGTSGWLHPEGMLGAMPMPHPDHDQQWRLIAYDPDTGSSARLTEAELLERILTILPERTGDDRIRILDTTWLSEFIIRRRLADRYRDGRVFLAGDSAHAHAPFGGQGMLTGIGDAENLGWKLGMVVRGDAEPELLDSYQAERRPLAEDVLRGTSTVTKIDIAEHPIARFLRDKVVVKVLNVGWIQRWVTYTTSQLWVSYRRGPLADASLHGGKPRPGDRVPDQTCRNADQDQVRLYEQLGDHWVLLLTGHNESMINVAEKQLGARLHRLYPIDTAQSTMLIRPDGHLAWRGANADDLDRWLASALQVGSVGRR